MFSRPSGMLPVVWEREMRATFADLQRSHRRLLESEATVRERRKRYRARVLKIAPMTRRLRGKAQQELLLIADLENMRDTRTVEDIADQNWMRARVASLATYMKSVVLMHSLGLLPEEPQG